MPIINTETREYPVPERKAREYFPNTWHGPDEWPAAPFATVREVSPPAYDRMFQALSEGDPTLVEGALTQTWVLTDLSAEQVQANIQSAQQAFISEVVVKVQQRLDNFAKATAVDGQGRVHGDYDGVNSAAKYANLTDAQIASLPEQAQGLVSMFRADCQYLSIVTAHTWAALWGIQAQVAAGNWPIEGAKQQPTCYEDIEPSLPVLEWPSV